MRTARLQELEEMEEMGTKLQATAHALPPGQDRHNILQEIGRFRARIVALQGAGLQSAHQGLKAKEK